MSRIPTASGGLPGVDVVGRRVTPGTISNDFTYSVVETTKAERRGEHRVKTRLREGLVKEGRGRAIADCRIRDLSQKGARLQLDRARPLPRTFVLTEGASRCAFTAVLIWQVGRDAGVRLAALPVKV